MAKVADVVGLYLNPPDNAAVVCENEKSQCQALKRTQPIVPMRSGIPERQTWDYVRHGVTCLFPALEVATTIGAFIDRWNDHPAVRLDQGRR